MFHLPSLRRLLLSALLLLAFVVFYKSGLRKRPHVPIIPYFIRHRPPPQGIRVPIIASPLINSSFNHQTPPKEYYYSYDMETSKTENGSVVSSNWAHPHLNPNLAVLFKCLQRPNRYTNHIRLSHPIRNISMIPPNPGGPDGRIFWNPTVLSLPYWSTRQYLIVSRIVTDGNHQQNVMCEADICHTGDAASAQDGERKCSIHDLEVLGPSGGLRCVTTPLTLKVPPTPAENCQGKFGSYVDIPGFHDPRIFWSGKGEPLMMVNTQSRYACFGLWVIDLRALYPPLQHLLSSSPIRPSLGPLMSYPSLTELTRNPASDRFPIEKNWMLFFPTSGTGGEAFLHYEISPHGGRSFAKLLGGGLTTQNLTDPFEQPCLFDVSPDESDPIKRNGSWHQATNSLRLTLCNRTDTTCRSTKENSVFFAVVHRKHPNVLKLPLRYERYFIVWSATAPFSMLGISQHPILMANETASGWPPEQGWDDVPGAVAERRQDWAYFTYTVSIAYAWGRTKDEPERKNDGYLDDEVLLAVGIDDAGQGFARAPVMELLGCLRACPGSGATTIKKH